MRYISANETVFYGTTEFRLRLEGAPQVQLSYNKTGQYIFGNT